MFSRLRVLNWIACRTALIVKCFSVLIILALFFVTDMDPSQEENAAGDEVGEDGDDQPQEGVDGVEADVEEADGGDEDEGDDELEEVRRCVVQQYVALRPLSRMCAVAGCTFSKSPPMNSA